MLELRDRKAQTDELEYFVRCFTDPPPRFLANYTDVGYAPS